MFHSCFLSERWYKLILANSPDNVIQGSIHGSVCIWGFARAWLCATAACERSNWPFRDPQRTAPPPPLSGCCSLLSRALLLHSPLTPPPRLYSSFTSTSLNRSKVYKRCFRPYSRGKCGLLLSSFTAFIGQAFSNSYCTWILFWLWIKKKNHESLLKATPKWCSV